VHSWLKIAKMNWVSRGRSQESRAKKIENREKRIENRGKIKEKNIRAFVAKNSEDELGVKRQESRIKSQENRK